MLSLNLNTIQNIPQEKYEPIANRFAQLLGAYNELLSEFTELLSPFMQKDSELTKNTKCNNLEAQVNTITEEKASVPVVPQQLSPTTNTVNPANKVKEGPYQCDFCHTVDTPEWRSGPNGKKTLCNRCGIRFSKLKKKMGNNPIQLSDLKKNQKRAPKSKSKPKPQDLPLTPLTPKTPSTPSTPASIPSTPVQYIEAPQIFKVNQPLRNSTNSDMNIYFYPTFNTTQSPQDNYNNQEMYFNVEDLLLNY